MQFTYTPEQQELRDRAQRLTDAIIPFEEPCEQGRGLPDESLAEIRRLTLEHELNAINMPTEWGGQGLSVLEQVIVQERLGQLTNALWDAVWRPANALRHCTPAQRERYLIPAINGERRDCFAVTEEKAGSDPSLIETVAERDGDGFRISGEKWFVTVGDVADFLIVQALVGDERAPTLFLVDKNLPGVSVKRTPAYMHTFVFEHPEFIFDGVAVGPEQVLGEIGGGYDLTREWFVEERLMIAARATGAAERALHARLGVGQHAHPVRRPDRLAPAHRRDDRRQRVRHRAVPHAHPPGRLGGRRRHVAQAAARQGGDGQAHRLGGGRAGHRPRAADLRRPWLHAREPGRAAVPRHPRGPHLGGHLGDPAHDHRQRGVQARPGAARSPTAWPSPPSMLELTDEQREIQRVCRDFAAREIRPISLAVDEADTELPREIWGKASRLGLTSFMLPEEYGGAGMTDCLTGCIVQEELSHGCSGIGNLITSNGFFAEPVLALGTEEQKQRWLSPLAGEDPPFTALAITEPESGSDAASIRTRARRVDGGYVLSGQKAWISNGGVSRFYVIFATVEPGSGHRGITAFLVQDDDEGLRCGPTAAQDGPAGDPQLRAVPRRRVRRRGPAASATRAPASPG